VAETLAIEQKKNVEVPIEWLQIEKIKYDWTLQSIEIRCRVVNPNEDDSDKNSVRYDVEKGKLPHKDFANALRDLRQDVVTICEIYMTEENFQKEVARIKVTGLSLSYSHDVLGVVIAAQRELLHSSAPLNLNTPHKIETLYGEEGDESQVMDPYTRQRIVAVMEEALLYIQGKRKPDPQQDIFSQTEEKKERKGKPT